MKIAVNVQSLVKGKMEGLGWFTYETMRRIVKKNPQHEFTFIFGKGIEKDFIFENNVKAVNIGPPFFRPPTWWLKFSFLLPRFVNKNKFDLFLSSDGLSSNQIKTKTVIVVHDINFVHFPEFLPKLFYWYYSMFFGKWINHADRIATVSQYSKNDIVKTYGVDKNKIDVMYNGAGEAYKPIADDEKTKTKNTYTEGNDYFLFVGALHPRKNIINLLKAFDKFKKNDKKNMKLIIVGERFYWNKPTENAYNTMQFKKDVIFTGRLDQDELKFVMGAAMALVYVSFFEGFGIPLVEAMSSHVPIITSDTSSMPEVVGKAALLVNPYKEEEIAEAMTKIATDESIRNKLIEEGKAQKKLFSWDNTADKLWETILKAVK